MKRCGLSFEEVCRYKYMLNVGSNGYANKLKYLFLTGSVVIWVKKDSVDSPAYLYLPTYLLAYLLTYLLAYLLTYLPTYLPTFLLTSYLLTSLRR